MSTEPLVSILMACYNAGPFLPATLESLLAQTWPRCEIIAVNDGSKDNTLAVLRDYEPRGLIVLDQPNGGQSRAFNRAMKAASGKYLVFMDADDLLAPDKIERQIEHARGLPPDWLITVNWTRFYGTPPEVFTPTGSVLPDLPPVDWLITLWNRGDMMHGSAWLVPKALVDRAGPWNEDLTLINDFEFFTRLVLASKGVSNCPRGWTWYRSGVPGTVSGRRSQTAWESGFAAMRLGTEQLLKVENSPRTREACAKAWRELYFDAYPDAAALRRRAVERLHALGAKLGRPSGGRLFTAASHLVGWRFARRFQRVFLGLRKRFAS